MRTLQLPELSFCNWHRWEDRHNIEGCNLPGVYFIAISDKELQGKKPDYADVSYIGMTNAKNGLAGRWQQFFNSIRGRAGHSGGNTVFGKLGHYDGWTKSLYVAAMPVECNVHDPDESDLLKMGWVTFYEYEAFSEYYLRFPEKRKPEFNTK